MPDDSRKTALSVLNLISDNSHTTLDSAIDKFLGIQSKLSRRDKALTTAIVYGVLRWREQLDFIVRHYSKTPFKKINKSILNILRMGIFQIKFLDKIPDSAAVNTSVNLSKIYGKAWAPKYVNGILRNVTRSLKEVSFPDPHKDAALSLSIEKSFPKWLLIKWIDRFGIEDTIRLCNASNQIPSITLRVNHLKTTRDKLAKEVEKEVKQIHLTETSPLGITISGPNVSIPELKPFKKGFFQVQDEAAQLVTLLLSPQPNEKILDACAGLGGKTGHIAQMMDNKGDITAVDTIEKKLESLHLEMQRLGINIVKTHKADIGKISSTKKLGKFDKILLDAPCSGLGVIRRNPDTKWSRQKKDLIRNKRQQTLFLNSVSHLIKKSGIILYSVCSIEPEECEQVIQTFLQSNPNFMIDRQMDNDPTLAPLINKEGYLKTYPHENEMDGFFAVRLKRDS